MNARGYALALRTPERAWRPVAENGISADRHDNGLYHPDERTNRTPSLLFSHGSRAVVQGSGFPPRTAVGFLDDTSRGSKIATAGVHRGTWRNCVAVRGERATSENASYRLAWHDMLNVSRLRIEWFLRGLSETGYIEGQNVALEYRGAEGRFDRLPAIAEELVRHQVNVIVSINSTAIRAAKAVTQSIPIVFVVGADPVETGLVANLNRPGANITGVSLANGITQAKRLELLYELLPGTTTIGYLLNPINVAATEVETSHVEAASRVLGVRLLILNATDPSEFEPAFVKLVSERASAIVIGDDTMLAVYADHLIALAARYSIAAMYTYLQAVSAGGLMSYGTDEVEAYRQMATYVGRILRGERPADLPVQQATRIKLAINLKTAKTLGLTFPTSLLVRADEVIE